MRTAAFVALAALMLAGGCGKKVMLRPADGQPLPQKPRTASSQPGVEQLLQPNTQSRPGRRDELISKSRPLQPDRFDLPPPG